MERMQQNEGVERGPANALVETAFEALGKSRDVSDTDEAVDDVVDRRDVPGDDAPITRDIGDSSRPRP